MTITQPKVWTYEDYLALPEDGNRYEIIEGVLYVTPAPIADYQYPLGELFALIRNFVKERKLGIAWQAPFEVHLSQETRPVQPDVLFIRADNLPPVGAKFFEGVPDLVIEALSPSTLRADKTVKFLAYEKAGVPEYWIVNPTKQSVEVYVLVAGTYQQHGDFSGDDLITSAVLKGFEVIASELFYRGTV